MKNPSPHRVVLLRTYFLGSLCLLLCLLAQPAQAILPSGWTGANIGSGIGSEAYTGALPTPYVPIPTDTFTVTGKGDGFWLNSSAHADDDRFTYTTIPAMGDIEIVARLVSFNDTTGGQAGLMIRQSNSTSEVNKAATFFRSNLGGVNSLAFEGWGPTVAANSAYYISGGGVQKAPLNPPYWMKLVRVGNNYGAYWSLDGSNWNTISTISGGALFGTGSFNVGFFVDTYFGTTPSTAVFDNLYIGAPRLKYKTSWVGNTSGGLADGYAPNDIFALWVKGDGTCYANGHYDESARSTRAYKDGKVAFWIDPAGADIANGGLDEGSITGNTANLFVATARNGNKVYRLDLNGNNPTTVSFNTPIGVVGGLAASAAQLFVSDTTNHNVRIVSLTSLHETSVALATVAHPGPMAFDGTNFWIIDCGSDFPLTNHVAPTYTALIKCLNPLTGADLGRTISGISNPTALAKHPTLDRLYICDNGPNQNVCYYTGLATTTPTYGASFSQTKGLWNPADFNPGAIYESGANDYRRFYGPTGVGFDSSGNIYVACNGTNPGPTGGMDLRKFDTSGNLVWKQYGLVFCQVGDFDPASDGQEIYTEEERFTMNYANTAPGSEWSYTAYTKNPFITDDPRNPGTSTGSINGVQVRRLAGNNVFMFTSHQGSAPPCVFYRFNNQGTPSQGGAATAFGMLNWGVGTHTLWFDTNANGKADTGETATAPATLGVFNSYDVDSGGDIWLALTQAWNGSLPSGIGRIPCTGTQTIGTSPNTASVPAYSLTNYQTFLCPVPIKELTSLKYDKTHDVMYCLGRKADATWVLARYDNWLTNGSPDEHAARFVVPLPDSTTDVTALYYGSATVYWGLGLAGDKVFVGNLWGPVRAYDANLGNPVMMFTPGPEVSATLDWDDMIMGMNVFQRSTGEYLMMQEDSGGYARNMLFRWTPTADTTVPGAITQLTATAGGHAIALSWSGPTGTVTSYSIYRGTTSGSLTLYQSNVNTSSFVDTNVTPGTTYYYKVAAVSTVGAGAQSSQVSASAISTQVEFVKYDLTTQGTWNPTGTRVYGADGYNIPQQTVHLPGYVASLTPVQVDTASHNFASDPSTDIRALQIPSGSGRTTAYYWDQYGMTQQWWDLTFNEVPRKWHQVSVYLMSWTDSQYVKVEVLDKATGMVLDTRQPMNFKSGKWLVWNVRGDVTIRLSNVFGSYPIVNGIFFDSVQTSAPTRAWWKLDETSGSIAGDSSGSGNNGTNGNCTWTAGAHSGFNGCLAFGGHDYDSNFGLPEAANLQKTTMSLWFKTSTSGVLVCSRLDPPGTTPTQYAPYLYVGTDNKLHGAFYTGVIQTMTSATSVNDNQWHHAALTSDGLTQTLYLDGEVAGLLVAPTSLLWYTRCGQGYVSGWPNISGPNSYFTGLIDDVRVYNRVLPSSEIWKLNQP